VENNLFQRIYQRIKDGFASVFGSKSNHELADHSGHTHHEPNTHSDHHSDHSHDHDHTPNHTHTTHSLAGLDLTMFHKIDTVIGNGHEAFPGADVTVHYTGWLIDTSASDLKGQKFDSSVDRGQTFNFPLGQGHVIRGWDEGFAGMKIGGKRTLLIPPEMGYGARGAGGVIPPNATLMFEVELFGVN